MKKYSVTQQPGKIIGLKNISRAGLIFIAAMDHRTSFLDLFNKELSLSQVRSLKEDMLGYLEPESSAILLDPNFGFGLGRGESGLILALESTGFTKRHNYKETLLLPGWNVGKIKKSGASGVKLVLYIDPTVSESVTSAHLIAEKVASECLSHDILFLLEPIVPKSLDNRGKHILEAIRLLSDIDADIFKIEYPGLEHIEEVNRLIPTPWTLLSGGIDYDEFKEALKISCMHGCSGFVAGRSLWREIGGKTTKAKVEDFLSAVVLPRFLELKQISKEYGNSLWNKAMIDNNFGEEWYLEYQSLN